MRVSTFSSLLAATLLATTGVLAQYDDEYSGALTARDLFEDDLLQERSFDDFEDYEARDFDDEFEARDYFEDDFEARDYYDDDFEARDFGDEDEWLVARTKYATLGGSGRTGGGRTGGPGSIPNRDRQSLIGATGPSRSPGRGLTGVPPRGKIGLSPPFRPTGVKLPGIGRGGTGQTPPNIKYASGMTGLRPPTGKRGAGRTKQSKPAAVEARDIYEALLEERGKMGPGGGPRGGPGGAGRRRRKNQRKRLRNKLRKQKAAAAAAAQEPAAGGAPDPSAGGAAPEAPQQRDFEVDELD